MESLIEEKEMSCSQNSAQFCLRRNEREDKDEMSNQHPYLCTKSENSTYNEQKHDDYQQQTNQQTTSYKPKIIIDDMRPKREQASQTSSSNMMSISSKSNSFLVSSSNHKSTLMKKNNFILRKIFHLLIVQVAISQLSFIAEQISENSPFELEFWSSADNKHAQVFPNNLITFAAAIECSEDNLCRDRDKVCHENKCICSRDKPIEGLDGCLPLAELNEQCALTEQCLGSSRCIDGICSCGSDEISMVNPSNKLTYCHKKRRLNEECNYDSQCPSNSYCSSKKLGCICSNGFSQVTVNTSGIENEECLAKFCIDSSTCETEFHECDDNKCKCVASHFDPTTGKCYKFFPSKDGTRQSEDLIDGNNDTTANTRVDSNNSNGGDNFYTNFKDLMDKNSDKMWLVLILLIAASILVLLLIFMLLRRHYLGYCWTAHKKEYEPNNKSQPKNVNYFNKNSINNKSFRQRTGDHEDEEDAVEDSAAEDRSNLVAPKKNADSNRNDNMSNVIGASDTTTSSSRAPFIANKRSESEQSGYIKVNINESSNSSQISAADNRHNHQPKSNLLHHHQFAPLASSTSTPV